MILAPRDCNDSTREPKDLSGDKAICERVISESSVDNVAAPAFHGACVEKSAC